MSQRIIGPELRSLVRLLAQHKARYLLGALFLCLSDGGQLGIGWLVGQAVDAAGSPGATRAMLAPYALSILGCAALVIVARFSWRQMIFGSARMIERTMRQRLLEHLQGLSASFFLNRKVGELMVYATNDIPAVHQAVSRGTMAALDAMIQAVGALTMMAVTVDPRLAVLSFFPLLFLAPTTSFLGKRLHARYGEVQGAFGVLSDRAQEAIAGIRVVKGYAREDYFAGEFHAANQDYRKQYERMLRYDSAFDPMIEIMAGLAFTLSLGYGGLLVMRGQITLGQFVSFNSYLMMVVWPMLAMGLVTNHVQGATASLKRLEALLAIPPEIHDAPDAKSLPTPRGHLQLVGLTFRYGPDLPVVLDGIDLDLPPGKTVGILGRTGSGKSTLAHVLLRVFDPPRGQVFLDGIDVLDLKLRDLRAAVAIVPQDTFLFSRTIAENIAFAPEDRTPAEVAAAAELADVARDIGEFPHGYATMLGERGITLSGGQRQRVTLARALIRNAPVLVLDDCLSAVDTATESRIVAALAPYLAGRATLIVAHRISALQHADEILVLHHGRVAERGSHAELLAAGGAYARLHRLQQLEAALEGVEGVPERVEEAPA